MKKHKLDNFFSTYPLYKQFAIIENNDGSTIEYTTPYDFIGETFSFYCSKEEREATFEIGLAKGSEEFWGRMSGAETPKEVLEDGNYLNYTQHIIGNCKSCKEYHIDMLLHVWSDKPVNTNKVFGKVTLGGGKSSSNNELQDTGYNIFVEKVGMMPEQDVPLNKDVSKYLDRESNGWYYKGNKALVANYGIGSFAYFRRIIEKELIRIVRDLSKLPHSDAERIKELLEEYESSKKPYLLYQNVYKYLPASLKALGENPLEILYKSISEGLHDNSTDGECLERATVINQVLEFVIKKIYEERSEILEIRNALKKLKAKEV